MAQRTIPVISSIPQLLQWQAGLRATLKVPAATPVPANFAIASKQGGNYLTWAQINGADGYEVEISTDGNFETVLQRVLLPGVTATAYFDTVPTDSGTTPTKRYYRVRSTSGTKKAPQSVFGRPTSVLGSTAIAPNDNVTASTSAVDASNRDNFNVNSGTGDYRLLSLPLE